MSKKIFGNYCGRYVNTAVSLVMPAGRRNPASTPKAFRGKLVDGHVPLIVERRKFKVEELKEKFMEVSG